MQTSEGSWVDRVGTGRFGHGGAIGARRGEVPATLDNRIARITAPAAPAIEPRRTDTVRHYNSDMRALSRRDFGKAVVAGMPLVSVLRRTALLAASDVIFGVCTSSFRELPRVTGRDNIDDI